jgi:hypothetical protein
MAAYEFKSQITISLVDAVINRYSFRNESWKYYQNEVKPRKRINNFLLIEMNLTSSIGLFKVAISFLLVISQSFTVESLETDPTIFLWGENWTLVTCCMIQNQ